MKNNFFFLIFFVLIGCSAQTPITEKVSCPNVLISEEHDKFIFVEENLEDNNIKYIADINNFGFESDCYILDDIGNFELELLFVIQPANTKESNIFLPFYVATINQYNELVDMQYYKADGNFKSIEESSFLIETEIRTKINYKLSYQDIIQDDNYTLIIGFMLSKYQLEILD